MPVIKRTPTTANELRVKGNNFYKSGDLTSAINAYIEAFKVSEFDDPTPVSNLSAAYFEVGSYLACAANTLSAISIIEEYESEKSDLRKYETIKQKCYSRLLRCYLYLEDYKELKRLIESKDLEREVKGLSIGQLLREGEFQKATKTMGGLSTEKEKKARWELIINWLPRYKPHLRSALEYFNLGHDSPSTLYDGDLAAVDDETVNFLFTGIGDARNLFATLTSIHSEEQKKLTKKKFHFTINDIKAPTLCRDLLLFLILDRIASSIKSDTQEIKDVGVLDDMTLLMYLFAAPLMPKYVWNRLQSVIKTAVIAFSGGESKLPAWLRGDPRNLDLLPAFQSWLEPNGEALKLYTTAEAVNITTRVISSRLGINLKRIEKDAPPGCQVEFGSFCETGLIFPPERVMVEYADELKDMLPLIRKELNAPGKKKPLWEKVRNYVENSWIPNYTFLDVEWEKTREHGDWDLEFNPFVCATDLFEKSGIRKPASPKGLFDYIAAFFLPVAKAIKFLKDSGRLTVFAIYEDQSHVMDLYRHNLLPYSTNLQNITSHGADANDSILFDRIHVSNIPDYIGGTLTTFLYAMPLLKKHPQAFLTQVCLRNPNLFPGGAYAFNAEYIHIPNPELLKKTFQAILHPDTKKHEDMLSNMMGIPLSHYFSWGHALDVKLPLEFSQLLDKKNLTTWLYSLFFKLVLPVQRDPALILRLVNYPLNLTIFFRLLIHLATIGYPKHWLSQILSDILMNNVKTATRPPQNSPVTKLELDSWYNNTNSVIKISTRPYIDEVATLARIFLPVLTFPIYPPPPSVYSSSDNSNTNKIKEYIYTPKQSFPPIYDNVDVLVLVFFNKPVLDSIMVDTSSGPTPLNMREVFYGRESNTNEFKGGRALGEFRDSGELIMVTTWDWDGKKKRGRFWMRESVMERMFTNGSKRDEDWWCGILRTDNWKYQGSVESVKVTVQVGRAGRWWM